MAVHDVVRSVSGRNIIWQPGERLRWRDAVSRPGFVRRVLEERFYRKMVCMKSTSITLAAKTDASLTKPVSEHHLSNMLSR
jgi:hypothetical protein